MSLRRRIIVSCLLSSLAVPTTAAAQTTERTIAPGVTAGGIDLGGQTIEGAATTLELALAQKLNGSVDVVVGSRSFRFEPAEADFAFEALTTAKRAYYATRDATPAKPAGDVPLKLTVSQRKVRAFAAEVDRKVSRAPRDASLRITLRRMVVTRPRTGRTINEVSLARRVVATLLDPARRRVLRARLNPDRPAVGIRQLRVRNATVLTVDRTSFKLRLFKRLKLSRTYRIAIGAAGYDTPGGLFRIQSRQVNPTWYVPNSDWAGALAGSTVPGGAPNNPLKARWLGVNGSVGIHGTAEEWSIGSRASKGCIRMRVRDVVDLYRRVPMGARVLIR